MYPFRKNPHFVKNPFRHVKKYISYLFRFYQSEYQIKYVINVNCSSIINEKKKKKKKNSNNIQVCNKYFVWLHFVKKKKKKISISSIS